MVAPTERPPVRIAVPQLNDRTAAALYGERADSGRTME